MNFIKKSLKRNSEISVKILLLLFVTFSIIYIPTKTYSQSITSKSIFQKNILQKTSYGLVQGAEVNNAQTLVWKGIPYGKSPVGDLRWKAPVSPEKWDGVFDATKSGKIGVQLVNGKPVGSEDCLNLDIYRPNTSDTNLPVMFYIHGGNNQSGTSEEINPQKFAINANVIVVSVNYRLGLLGFNNLPALKTGNKLENSGNYTLLDIAKALDWVKENISNFGGNSNNVTLSGFSAGGRDVMAILISPMFDGKFQKAISFSGGMTIADSKESEKLFAKAIAPFVVEDKVKGTVDEAYKWLLTSGKDVKSYLYGLSPERLSSLMTNAGIRMEVFPHLFNDGVVLPKDGFSTKKYNNVPLIMITGSSEFSLFGRFDKAFAPIKDDVLLADTVEAKNYQFAYKYGGRLYGMFNAQESAERMFNNYKSPIYTCDFDWGTDAQIFGERTANIYGALHGIWIPFLMSDIQGASGLVAGSLQNAGAKDLTKKFTAYVSNFMWNGNPNGTDLVKWDSWTNANKDPSQLILNADMDKAIITMSNERDTYDKVIIDIKNDTSVSPEAKEKLLKEVLNGRWFSKKLDETFNSGSTWVQVK